MQFFTDKELKYTSHTLYLATQAIITKQPDTLSTDQNSKLIINNDRVSVIRVCSKMLFSGIKKLRGFI